MMPLRLPPRTLSNERTTSPQIVVVTRRFPHVAFALQSRFPRRFPLHNGPPSNRSPRRRRRTHHPLFIPRRSLAIVIDSVSRQISNGAAVSTWSRFQRRRRMKSGLHLRFVALVGRQTGECIARRLTENEIYVFEIEKRR